MKGKFFILLTAFLLMMCSLAEAQERTIEEAKQIAEQFVSWYDVASSRSDADQKSDSLVKLVDRLKGCYLYNVTDCHGWVVVNRNPKGPSILAFSEKGQLDMANMPEGMKKWLAACSSCQDEKDSESCEEYYEWPDINPLLTTEWGQFAPYNLMLPMVANRDSVLEGKDYYWTPAATGCVVVAICQLMNYYKWPKETLAPIVYEYDGPWLQYMSSTLEELPITTFEWDEMKDVYEPTDSSCSAWAVAKLMRYVGQSLPTTYCYENNKVYAGSSLALQKLVKYFGYSDSIRVYRTMTSYRETRDEEIPVWTLRDREEKVYAELKNGCPVLILGVDYNNKISHTFLCDGYQDPGFFHINWGWNGLCNGYFHMLSFVLEEQDKKADYSIVNYMFVIYPSSSVADINESIVERKSDGYSAIYDFSGRRLKEAPQKGIYIKDGKKIYLNNRFLK